MDCGQLVHMVRIDYWPGASELVVAAGYIAGAAERKLGHWRTEGEDRLLS